MLDPLQARRKEEFINPQPLPDRGNVQLYLKSDPGDIIGRYRILSTQNEGWAASLWGRALPRALDGRLRGGCLVPITVTTVGGLIPLAFFASGQAKFLSPMAIAVVWGLSFATVLTLILVPCLYAMLDDVKGLVRRQLRLPIL